MEVPAAVSPEAADRRIARWPLVVGLVVALALTAAIAMRCRSATDGILVYALDDAYIHLAMGRTLADSGVWGVNAQTPGAASSSPVWTFALAGLCATVGATTVLPLLLNAAAVIALVIVADAWLREMRVGPRGRIATVVVMLAVGPVAPMVMTGMEHVAHAAAVLALTLAALRSRPLAAGWLFVLAALATGLRYESPFVAAALALVLALRGDWRRATGTALGSVALVVGVGLWQISLGQGFLPNSLIVKGVGLAGQSTVGWVAHRAYESIKSASEAPAVLLPIVAALLALGAARRGRAAGEESGGGADLRPCMEHVAVLGLATLAHLALAKTGWYFRYEAYLVIWGTVVAGGALQAWWVSGDGPAVGSSLPNALRRPALLAALCVVFIATLAFGLRIKTYYDVTKACGNIYHQHYQMARFIHRYYEGEPVVVHDVGYVSYLCDCPILDPLGLASHDVAVALSEGRVDEQYLTEAAREHGARLAISYRSDWIPTPPDAWIEIASWTIPERRSAGEDTTYLFAIEPDHAPTLLRRVREFEAEMPPPVEVRYADEAVESPASPGSVGSG